MIRRRLRLSMSTLLVCLLLGLGLAGLKAWAQDLPPVAPGPKKVHPKLPSVLQELFDEFSKDPVKGRAFMRERLHPKQFVGDSVRLILWPQGMRSANIPKGILKSLGIIVEAESPSLLQVLVPIPKLILLANQLPAVQFIELPIPPQPLDVPPRPLTISQGVTLTGANTYHNAGITGSGVKVAIIDLGFQNIQTAINNGEFGSPHKIDPTCTKNYITNTTGIAAVDTGGTDHGVSVAHVVHNMAPGASLCLKLIDTLVHLENAKNDAKAEGVRVINHSVGWVNLNSYYDGTGTIDGFVNDAFNNNILWANSAGNAANGNHWQGGFFNPDGDVWLNFTNDDECNNVFLSAGQVFEIFMNWDDYPASSQDYDLFLYRVNPDGTLTRVASSEGFQNGTQQPEEAIFYSVPTTATYCWAIKNFSGPATAEIEVFSFTHDFEHFVASSSLMDPANGPKVMAVAAIRHTNWTTGPQEPFSSQGPTNNSKFATARVEPAISGPDGTIDYDGTSAFGTSFSSPHVAGCAALIKAANPGFTAAQIRNKMETDAIDMGAPGKDNIFGWGRLNCTLVTRTLTVTGAGTGNGTVTATGISCTITAGSTSGDCSESYPDGTSVTLTATAASGSTFAGWTNCDAPSGNQCTMTMNANKTVTATFNVVMRTLTVAGAGTGNGTVTATGISCTITAGSTSGDCSESYPDGTSVTLTATAASGSTFAGWTNCDAPSGNQCTMTMNANKTVTATFNVVMRTLTVTGAGTGNGTVTATGISCTITAGSTSGDCSESYPDGTSVTLTATAASGSTFAGWTNCDAPSGNQCTMTMNANKTVTATFNVVMRTLTVAGAGTGSGTVTATGISCTITAGSTSGDCSESYPDGTSVTLTATAASGSTFAGWTNCDAPSGNQCTMTMNANKTVTATFNVVMRTLTVAGAGTGSGTVTATGISCTITAGSTSGDCSESYPDGTSVTLTATAASGSTFAGWTNCDAPSGNQCTMTMNANKTVTATFNVVMRTLTVAGAGTGNGTVTATGISCTITAGSTSGDCSESYPDGTSVTLTATAASGSTFAGWTNCDAPSGNQCTMTMNANKTVTATFNILGPANDNFANAQDISGDSGNITGSNVGATKEPCEPNHHNIPGGASVWYRWTAPIGGNATFDTFGSNFDTVLAVYTGDNLCSLTYIASSDDDPLGGLQSRVSFNAVAGTTYHIAVDGFGGFSSSGVERAFGDKISTAAVAMGDIVLNWSVVEAQADEDFETGNLSKFPWETGGRDRWIVTNAASHSGNYSARAPLSLRDGRQAYLQVTLLVETGMISFWRKVSSEQNRDFLKFYIDGVLQGQWSGEVDWEQVSFPVTAGEHTFKWVYTKDRSRSGGQDTAWIDDIDFPPLHPCYGVTISSSPASVTYRPTPTRPDRKTIRVTVTNQSGAPQTVIDIVKQPDEPFEIVSISPPLPQMIADGARQTFSVLTERAAGSGRATARRPYFEITLSCGMLTLASEPSLLMPLQPNDVQVKLQGNHLQVEAQGANIATVRLQLYDLLGRLILDQEGRGNTMVLPAKTAQDTPLANGVYLYVVRVRGFDDREYVSEVRKLVIMR
jgi:hypothetical protein